MYPPAVAQTGRFCLPILSPQATAPDRNPELDKSGDVVPNLYPLHKFGKSIFVAKFNPLLKSRLPVRQTALKIEP